MRALSSMAAVALMLVCGCALAAEDEAPNHKPVKVVADARLSVGGKGLLPLYLSNDWSMPLPAISRAVIVLHGRLRNADEYYISAHTAQVAAGDDGKSALMIAPQFLAEVDIDAHKLPADTLRWSLVGWEGGEAALAPNPVSSFEALDAILARLSDRRIFPNLKQVVIAGHSGGGQVTQRYAIAGKGEAALSRQHIEVRYVVANSSSYAYFSGERPVQAIAASCQGYNVWKYGMDGRPPYLADATPAALEQRYVERDVIYLLGTLDTKPAADKSCMGEAQGPNRYVRGHAYADAMAKRSHGAPNHRVWDVAGIGHDVDKMLTSKCGLAALFDSPGCGAER
ncbi:alpha/beta hydrolase [Bradyrhizobium arachidis]|uniref:alpha/beta hydrolase n=1 Tax=Bradyrhizobium TaxID=374 RepID=UPI002161CA04|nr:MULTISPECIES: alpha/beta hydrolase [Bradyrhizobium]MDN4987327.1 alpha/beta hydrolase [Bradyrhizobium sp. WYCCWR 13022]UVO37410.1 alpha/beta hydrolase [Bradyrhizobium arachidis]